MRALTLPCTCNSDSANGILQRYKIGHVKGAWLQRSLKEAAEKKKKDSDDLIDWSKPIVFQVSFHASCTSYTDACTV
jgi:hypothetical protein